MKPNTKTLFQHQPFLNTKQNYSNRHKNEKPINQKGSQNTCNIKILDYNQSEKKENINLKPPSRTVIPKWFDDQSKDQKQQKLRRPLTIEIDQNSKQRSYSALPVLKQWSPTIDNQYQSNLFKFQDKNNSGFVSPDTQHQLFFAYFILDYKLNTFQPTILPLERESVDNCYNFLLNLLNNKNIDYS